MNKRIHFIIILAIALFLGLAFTLFTKEKSSAPEVFNSTSNQPTKDDYVMNSDTQPSSAIQISSGNFNRIDNEHYAIGTASIYDTEQGPILSFMNFESADGPDLYVYLSKNTSINNKDSDLGDFVSLGKLQSLNGEQNYTLPQNYQDYKSVVIWCEKYSTLFSSAELKSIQ